MSCKWVEVVVAMSLVDPWRNPEPREKYGLFIRKSDKRAEAHERRKTHRSKVWQGRIGRQQCLVKGNVVLLYIVVVQRRCLTPTVIR